MTCVTATGFIILYYPNSPLHTDYFSSGTVYIFPDKYNGPSVFKKEVSQVMLKALDPFKNGYRMWPEVRNPDENTISITVKPTTKKFDKTRADLDLAKLPANVRNRIRSIRSTLNNFDEVEETEETVASFRVFQPLDTKFNGEETVKTLKTIGKLFDMEGKREHEINYSLEEDTLRVNVELEEIPDSIFYKS